MTWLLDVNALLAAGFALHPHHQRVGQWMIRERELRNNFVTCAVTELGFVRIASGVAAFGPDLPTAQLILEKLIRGWTLLPDALGAATLPAWVTKSAQTTDGHLLELARAHEASLATLDTGIPGAFVLPS